MLFDPGLDFEGGLKALNDVGGSPDGFHPAADPDWLLSALNRGGGQAFDFLASEEGVAPPPIPTGFDLDLTDRKAADDFLLYGAGEPEPEPEPTPVDDVIVPGVRVIPGSTVGITIGDIPDPFGGDPGGGGGVLNEPQDPGHAGEDCALNEIRDEINQRSTNDTAEHSSAVYRGDDGRYRSTPVFTGSSGSAPIDSVIIWLIENGIPFGQVTSLYHNHDSAGGTANASETAVNQYPSHLFAANGYGDWFIAGLFVNPPAAFGQASGANPAVFRMVIEDTGGTARSFNYQDRAFYESLTLEQMVNGLGLPAALGGCGGSQ